MVNYVHLYFLPGSAGNFLSRCLNLLDDFYAWGDLKTKLLPVTLDEKINLLNYSPVINFDPLAKNWIEWENAIAPLVLILTVPDCRKLPNDPYIVYISHPIIPDITQEFSGPDDGKYILYIDPTDNFEWILMNAIYKQTYQETQWYVNGKQMLEDDTVIKISLTNILKNKESFLEEFQLLCTRLSQTISPNILIAIGNLYDQWRTTIIEPDKINDFKKLIGWTA